MTLEQFLLNSPTTFFLLCSYQTANGRTAFQLIPEGIDASVIDYVITAEGAVACRTGDLVLGDRAS